MLYTVVVLSANFYVRDDPIRIPADAFTYIEQCPVTPFEFQKFSVFCTVLNYGLFFYFNIISFVIFLWFVFFSDVIKGLREKIWIVLTLSPIYFFLNMPTKEPMYLASFIVLLAFRYNYLNIFFSTILMFLPRFELGMIPILFFLKRKLNNLNISAYFEYIFFSFFAFVYTFIFVNEVKSFEGSRIEIYNNLFYEYFINYPYASFIFAFLYYMYLILSWLRVFLDPFSVGYENLIAIGFFGSLFSFKDILNDDRRRTLFFVVLFSCLLSGHLHFRYALPMIILINKIPNVILCAFLPLIVFSYVCFFFII